MASKSPFSAFFSKKLTSSLCCHNVITIYTIYTTYHIWIAVTVVSHSQSQLLDHSDCDQHKGFRAQTVQFCIFDELSAWHKRSAACVCVFVCMYVDKGACVCVCVCTCIHVLSVSSLLSCNLANKLCNRNKPIQRNNNNNNKSTTDPTKAGLQLVCVCVCVFVYMCVCVCVV